MKKFLDKYDVELGFTAIGVIVIVLVYRGQKKYERMYSDAVRRMIRD